MGEVDEERDRAARAGDPVGLGSVVANPAGLGVHREAPGADEPDADSPEVDEASEESFPASDPPAGTAAGLPGTTGARDPDATGRPTA